MPIAAYFNLMKYTVPCTSRALTGQLSDHLPEAPELSVYLSRFFLLLFPAALTAVNLDTSL